MKRSSFLVCGLFLIACGGSDRPESSSTSGALGDDTGTTTKVELVQAGFFGDENETEMPRYVPRLAHVGFADARGGGWEGVTDVPIAYASGRNEAVVVEVPAAFASKKLLVYSIEYDVYSAFAHQSYSKGWMSDLALPLAAPKGKWVTVPVSSGAGYPFSPECYGVSVQHDRFDGRLRAVLYGFTDATQADYEANNDVPWLDVEGNRKLEGVIPVSFAHDGGYKGSYVSSPVWVRVPEGKNLVFKASLDRFSGSCYTDSDTTPIQPPAGQDSHLTKTYFEQVH